MPSTTSPAVPEPQPPPSSPEVEDLKGRLKAMYAQLQKALRELQRERATRYVLGFRILNLLSGKEPLLPENPGKPKKQPRPATPEPPVETGKSADSTGPSPAPGG